MITYEKVQELKLNHEYTYEKLCNALGEERVKGTLFYAQKERWSKYFEWQVKGRTTARRFIVTKIYKQMPINTCYEIDGKIFNSLKEADDYRKSL